MKRCLFVLLGILILASIISGIYFQLTEYYTQTEPKLQELVKIIEPMFRNDTYHNGVLNSLNNRDILSEVRLYEGNKSYTINKERIFMCLKDENKNYYHNNFLIFVLIHEMAHVICDEVGHTQKFHNIFEELIKRAVEMGIYNPKIPVIKNYCEY